MAEKINSVIKRLFEYEKIMEIFIKKIKFSHF